MEKHSQVKFYKKVLIENNLIWPNHFNKELSFHPVRPTSVPDFKKEHEKFKKTLDKRKIEKPVTEIVPFKIKDMQNQKSNGNEFYKNKIEIVDPVDNLMVKQINIPIVEKYNQKNEIVESLKDQNNKENTSEPINDPAKIEKQKQNRKTNSLKPKLTQKVLDHQKLTQKNRIESEKKSEELKLQLELKKKEQSEKAIKFREKFNFNSTLSISEKVDILVKNKLQEQKEREAQYKKQIDQISEKLENRDYFLNRIQPEVIQKKQNLDKIKALLKAHQIFVSKNSNADVTQIFTREELVLIKEGQFLEKHGLIK